jgi:hypothetical protein
MTYHLGLAFSRDCRVAYIYTHVRLLFPRCIYSLSYLVKFFWLGAVTESFYGFDKMKNNYFLNDELFLAIDCTE